jgi:hypothetical protein
VRTVEQIRGSDCLHWRTSTNYASYRAIMSDCFLSTWLNCFIVALHFHLVGRVKIRRVPAHLESDPHRSLSAHPARSIFLHLFPALASSPVLWLLRAVLSSSIVFDRLSASHRAVISQSAFRCRSEFDFGSDATSTNSSRDADNTAHDQSIHDSWLCRVVWCVSGRVRV